MTHGRRHLGAVTALCLLALAAGAAGADTILFVGNSFTYGDESPVQYYRPDTVTDLNDRGFGGVPALFKAFSVRAGLDYEVSLDTIPGANLRYHFEKQRTLIDRAWDVLILQDYSTLDHDRPGDPRLHVEYSGLLAQMFRRRNPAARISIVATWSRADQTWHPEGHWYGKPIQQMALDLRVASDLAMRRAPEISSVIPVGEAWNRAMARQLADANPYDGIAPGQIDLWAADHYHGSTHGYYLSALVIFGAVTGRDPRSLGGGEPAASDLGIASNVAAELQQIAYEELRTARARSLESAPVKRTSP